MLQITCVNGQGLLMMPYGGTTLLKLQDVRCDILSVVLDQAL